MLCELSEVEDVGVDENVRVDVDVILRVVRTLRVKEKMLQNGEAELVLVRNGH